MEVSLVYAHALHNSPCNTESLCVCMCLNLVRPWAAIKLEKLYLSVINHLLIHTQLLFGWVNITRDYS